MATIKQLQTLFGKLGIAAPQRHQRIYAWTSGRTQTSKELQADELQELCDSLASEVQFQKSKIEDAKRLRRSSILIIATNQGIKHRDPQEWDSFNNFMLHKSCVKKSLRLCSIDELDKVLLQFRALQQSNAISAQTPGTKAYFNQYGLPKISKN
jgi:hypothetical protein